MPDGKIAVVHEGEKQVFAIVGRTWPGETLSHADGIEYRIYMVPEIARGRVESDFAEVVFFVLEMRRIFLLLTCQEVERFSIGRKNGCVLAPIRT